MKLSWPLKVKRSGEEVSICDEEGKQIAIMSKDLGPVAYKAANDLVSIVNFHLMAMGIVEFTKSMRKEVKQNISSKH